MLLHFNFSILCMYVHICVFTCTCMCHSMHIEVWEQHSGMSFLFPLCGFHESNLSHQAWWQALMPAKPSCWHFCQIFDSFFKVPEPTNSIYFGYSFISVSQVPLSLCLFSVVFFLVLFTLSFPLIQLSVVPMGLWSIPFVPVWTGYQHSILLLFYFHLYVENPPWKHLEKNFVALNSRSDQLIPT